MPTAPLAGHPNWTRQPLPTTPLWGTVEHATRLLLVRCAARWPDAPTLLGPLLGLNSPADQQPPNAPQLADQFDVSPNRIPYLLSMISPLCRTVGPPASVRAAVDLAAAHTVIAAPALSALWQHAGHTDGLLHPGLLHG